MNFEDREGEGVKKIQKLCGRLDVIYGSPLNAQGGRGARFVPLFCAGNIMKGFCIKSGKNNGD